MSLARRIGALFASATSNIDAAVGGAPAGVVLPYAGSAAPSGWLLCAGQEVSRTTYAALDAVIGTTYGAYTNGSGGAGTTHMRLPDLRGRVPGGKDDMGGAAASRLTAGGSGVNGATLGAVGGAETHILINSQLPNQAIGTGGSTVSRGSGTADLQVIGNSQAHNNTQPTIVLNYIIKT
jgi:microcystin-dependent protein